MANQLGAARLLVAVYAVFAISASARATYQIVFEFREAPIAYSLSAIAATVYLLATYLLASARLRKYAKYAIWFELIGVVTVGSLSLLFPDVFRHSSVWSQFGIGYGFIPLALPAIGLIWLRKINV